MRIFSLHAAIIGVVVLSSSVSFANDDDQWKNFSKSFSISKSEMISLGVPNVFPQCAIVNCGGAGGGVGINPVDPRTWVEKAKDVLKQAGDTVAAAAGDSLGKIVAGATDSFVQAIAAALSSTDKAVSDGAKNLMKAANDIVDVAKAVERFAEREVQGTGRLLKENQERLQQGKILDAVWHFGTDRYGRSGDNILQAGEENQIIADATTAAATFYGGPGGAATLAAARTYRRTGDLGAAMRMAALTYASTAGAGAVEGMPAGSLGEVMKKAGAAGAVGGIVAAASGGDQDEVAKAFVRSGGAVIMQSGEAYAKSEIGNPIIAKANSQCASVTGSNCEAVKAWYERNASKLKELQSKSQSSGIFGYEILISKDKDYVITWDKEGILSGDPGRAGVVVTFVGQGSQYKTIVSTIADLGSKKESPLAKSIIHGKRADLPENWVALQHVGVSTFFFERAVPLNDQSPFKVGDILRANRDVILHERIEARASYPTGMPAVTKNGLVVVRGLRPYISPSGAQQMWARVERVQ